MTTIEVTIKDTIGVDNSPHGACWRPTMTLDFEKKTILVDTELKGQGSSFDLYHGRSHAFTLPNMQKESVTSWIEEEVKPRFEKALEEYSSEYNHQTNLIGTLTEDGQELMGLIASMIQGMSGDVRIWEAADYYNGIVGQLVRECRHGGNHKNIESLIEYLDADNGTDDDNGDLLIINRINEFAEKVWAQAQYDDEHMSNK